MDRNNNGLSVKGRFRFRFSSIFGSCAVMKKIDLNDFSQPYLRR
jgi:hypothetical protein